MCNTKNTNVQSFPTRMSLTDVYCCLNRAAGGGGRDIVRTFCIINLQVAKSRND